MAEVWTKTDDLLHQWHQAQRARDKEALRLFRPMEHQIPFLRSTARIRILRGGNRCLGGEQLIYDPVLNVSRRVDEIENDFHVLSRDPATGDMVVKSASAPFIKSYGALYRVTLSNGESLITTLEHRVLDAQGRWISVRDAWTSKTSLACVSSSDRARNGSDDLSASPYRHSDGMRVVARQGTAPSMLSTRQLKATQPCLAYMPAEAFDRVTSACSERTLGCTSAYWQSPLTSVFRAWSGVGRLAAKRSELSCVSSKGHAVSDDHAGLGRSLPVVAPSRLGWDKTQASETGDRRLEIQTVLQSLRDASQGRSRSIFGEQLQHHTQEPSPLLQCSSSNTSTEARRYQENQTRVGGCVLEEPQRTAHSALDRDDQDENVRRLNCKAPDCRDDCLPDFRLCDERPLLEAAASQSSFPLRDDVREHTHWCLHRDDSVSIGECIPQDLMSHHLSKPGRLHRTVGRVDVTGYLSGEATWPLCVSSVRNAGQSRRETSAEERTSREAGSSQESQSFESSHPLKFAVDNTSENCIVESVSYLRQDFIYDLTVVDVSNYIASTLTNANSGKTLSSFALTASAATGMPIWINDTEMLPYAFPTNRAKKIWLVGKGVAHIGQTIYRMLFTEDNGLRVIRDEHTQQWRSWNPNLEYDRAYKEKCAFADPFIPPRLIKPNGIGWEDKRLDFFKQVELVDGTMIYAFTSGGDAKQGDAVDLIHIDEDIEYPEHTMEWFMRLADYKGRMFWSVYPHSDNNALRDFHQMAEEEKCKADPIAEEFLLRFDQNEYIDQETREQQLQVLLYSGEATYRARNLGEFTFDTTLVYPSFSPKVHTALIPDEKKRDEIDRLLRDTGGEPPDDWTRYFVLDPGHAVCAGLFLAVPPPELGNYIIAYDEIYQRQSDAHKMAEACSLKMAGHSFQDFIMDWHGGRITPMGMSKTVKMIYREAFTAFGLRSIVRGSDFAWSSDNVSGGIEQVRGWLSLQENGLPTLRLYLPRTPHSQKEFGLYSMRIRSGDICDEPVAQNSHLMDDYRYGAAANLKYVRPRRSLAQINPAYRAFMKDRDADKSQRKRSGQDFVNLGPGAAL